jgi:hypothetical protein
MRAPLARSPPEGLIDVNYEITWLRSVCHDTNHFIRVIATLKTVAPMQET